jgi:hypothetical protein
MAQRSGPSVTVLGADGVRKSVLSDLASFDSMMTHAANPEDMLELLVMRERMKSWRFYDHFRTDADAPARRPQIGTRTPVLAADGHDLASAMQTIHEIGDSEQLAVSIDDAFPGSEISVSQKGRVFRTKHDSTRIAQATPNSRTFRRHVALSSADGCTLEPEAATTSGPQRTRNKFASRFAPRLGPSHRICFTTLSSSRGVPCSATRTCSFGGRGVLCSFSP